MYTSSSFDEKTGDLIVKVVNTTNIEKELNIKINGEYNIPSNASVQYITSENQSDTNSFENPEKIAIKTKEINNVSNDFVFEAEKNSVNVIRINITEGSNSETPVEPEKPLEENKAPEINASDVTITVGDDFNPLNGVNANDYEDGDLTSKIIVEENTVNTEKSGEYKVVYKVIDSKGLEVLKEIKVTVKDKVKEENKVLGTENNNNGKLPHTGGAVLGLVLSGVGSIIIGRKLSKK